MDLESMLTGLINNRLTKKAAALSQTTEREDRRVHNSTRRAFESRMKSDAAVARMAAQNMDDAKSMVTVAQTQVTAIKSQFQEIQKSLIECANTDSLTQEEVRGYQKIINEHAEEIIRLAQNAEFNGMKLMDGGGGQNAVSFQLQAGYSSRDQNFMNLCNTSLGAVLGTDSMDVTALFNNGAICSDLDLENNYSTYQSKARTALNLINQCVDRMEGLEGQYSHDYKSLDNLSILFEDQADIYEGTLESSRQTNTDNASVLAELLSQGSSSILSGSA